MCLQVQNQVKTSTTVNIWDSSKIGFSMPTANKGKLGDGASNANRLIIDVSKASVSCNTWVTSNVTNSFSCNGFSTGFNLGQGGYAPVTAEFTQSNMPAAPKSGSSPTAAIVAVANGGFTKPPGTPCAVAVAKAASASTAGGDEQQYESDFESESGGENVSTAAGTSPGASLSPNRMRLGAQDGDEAEEQLAMAAARRQIKEKSQTTSFFPARLKSALSGKANGEDLLARSKT